MAKRAIRFNYKTQSNAAPSLQALEKKQQVIELLLQAATRNPG